MLAIKIRALILLSALMFPGVSVYADIYFSSRTIGPSTNIYSINSTGQLQKITDNEAWKDAEADISGTGEIVFMSNRKDKLKIELHKQTEQFNIFKLSLKDRQIEQLTSTPRLDHSPTISENGEWIAWLQKAGNHRKMMLLKNGESTAETLAIADNIFTIDWSPGNRILAFTALSEQQSRLYVYDVVKKERMLLLEVPTMPIDNASAKPISNAHYNSVLDKEKLTDGYIVSSAQWSPDGKKLAVILAATSKQRRELYVLNLWSKTATRLSNTEAQVQQPVCWSPDSETVLYSGLIDYNFYFDEERQRKVYEGSMQIYLADLEGAVSQLTSGEVMHNRPVFSPDGEKIAFFYGDNLGERTLALHTLDLKSKKRQQLYDRVAGDSWLIWR